MKFYAAFAKRDDALRMVYGYASTEALDSHGEIVTRAALKSALPDFMRFANIREMHQPSAVGRAEEASIDEKGLYLAAHVVDDAAWEKVKAGVYNGFSIAGRVTARDPAQDHVITGCTLTEISLVDRPANPEAVFDLIKQADAMAADLLAKEGRRNSAADQARIQAIHDHACDMGASCPSEDDGDDPDMDDQGEPDDSDAVEKRFAPALDRIARSIDRLSREISAQGRRLSALEAEPVLAKGALRALSKGEDLGDPAIGAPAGRDTHALIKEALGRPRIF